MYKYQNMQLPQAFDSFFTRGSNIHDRATRNVNEYRIPKICCNVGEKFIKKCGIKIWTDITATIDVKVPIHIFKKWIIFTKVTEYT